MTLWSSYAHTSVAWLVESGADALWSPVPCRWSCVGWAELELDEILHARAKLNEMIRKAVQDAANTWGMEVRRGEDRPGEEEQ